MALPTRLDCAPAMGNVVLVYIQVLWERVHPRYHGGGMPRKRFCLRKAWICLKLPEDGNR